MQRGEVLPLVSGGEVNGEDPTLVLQIGDPVPGMIPGSLSGGGVGRKAHKCTVIGVNVCTEEAYNCAIIWVNSRTSCHGYTKCDYLYVHDDLACSKKPIARVRVSIPHLIT